MALCPRQQAITLAVVDPGRSRPVVPQGYNVLKRRKSGNLLLSVAREAIFTIKAPEV